MSTSSFTMPGKINMHPCLSNSFPRKRWNFLLFAPKNAHKQVQIVWELSISSFELARDFQEVVGFDFSAAFIKAATDLQENGSKSYETTVEGNTKETQTAKVNFFIACSTEKGSWILTASYVLPSSLSHIVVLKWCYIIFTLNNTLHHICTTQ
jgi:hypothetical protein